VVGSAQQLGNWKEFKAKMRWTEGHIWVIDGLEFENHQAVFQYKYVVLNHGSPERWEEGFNRIADLRLLAHQAQGQGQLVLGD